MILRGRTFHLRLLALLILTTIISADTVDEQEAEAETENTKIFSTKHPLTPLDATEILETSKFIKLKHLDKKCRFVSIILREPSKTDLAPYLAKLSKLNGKLIPHTIPRKSFTIFIDENTKRSYQAIVDLSELLLPKQTYIYRLPPNVQPPDIYSEDFITVRKILLDDVRITDWLHNLGLSNMDLVDFHIRSVRKDSIPSLRNRRLFSADVKFKNFEGDNLSAHPLHLNPIVDVLAKKVLFLEQFPVFQNFSNPKIEKMKIPLKSINFNPSFLPKNFLRLDVKPIKVESIGGPSFKIIDGYQVEWQKFHFRLGFNHREGIVLHDVRYQDGQNRRPLLYDARISELYVNYGDPRPPYTTKLYYDFGSRGAGAYANSQVLGQDCLPDGHLIDAVVNDEAGQPRYIPGAICIYEEDGGILHKHTDAAGTTFARAINLVIQSIATITNYEYIFIWRFHQDASISYEAKPTGLIVTNLLAENVNEVPYATIVGDQLQAQFHQHLFCARLDTMFDGEANTVSTSDIHPVWNSKNNPHGQGITITDTILRTESEGRSDTSPKTDRTWKISNPNVIHPITKSPVAWKLIPINKRLLLAKPKSGPAKKAAFAKHAVWVTRHHENELYAAGRYTNRPIETAIQVGLLKFVANNESIVNEDIVLWHTFGLTHIPRCEDFPLMGVESLGFMIKPCGFFESYPGLDVPSPPEQE